MRSAPARTGSAPATGGRTILPEAFTLRGIVLAGVVLVALVVLIPTGRAYVEQTTELRELRNELSAATQTRDDLQVELDRWSDDAYVVAQARERLSFVLPGERSYRVLDPDTVVDTRNPETGQAVGTGAVESGFSEDVAWYESLAGSVTIAGEAGARASEDNG
ncbi:FtsB family cell division protein [Paraoerskovia marina]|uniref:FtsB family cell division protein n=1 Tax=Paraoerskovia marina TaxID=545619 RepID=UPI00069403A4|nr:septum formation initiator family protein [Paraoerskovia marina]